MYKFMIGEENEPNNNWPRGCEPMTDEQGIIYVFFERGDQHQICGGSSKCSLSIFWWTSGTRVSGKEGTEGRKQEKTLLYIWGDCPTRFSTSREERSLGQFTYVKHNYISKKKTSAVLGYLGAAVRVARAARSLLAESGYLESPVRRHLLTEMAGVSLAAESSCFASSL